MEKTPTLTESTTDSDLTDHPLELSTEQMVLLVDEALAHIAAHIASLAPRAAHPAWTVARGPICSAPGFKACRRRERPIASFST